MDKDVIPTEHWDVEKLLRRAAELLSEAKASTGEKAEQLRGKAAELLEVARTKADIAARKGKDVALSTDEFVKQNPWQAVAIGAGIGLLVGVLAGRR